MVIVTTNACVKKILSHIHVFKENVEQNAIATMIVVLVVGYAKTVLLKFTERTFVKKIVHVPLSIPKSTIVLRIVAGTI